MKVIEARVGWEADKEQYWRGHGVSFTDYDECVTGCGSTLLEAFDDALGQLDENDTELNAEQENELTKELISSCNPSVIGIDVEITEAYCDDGGKHAKDCEECDGTGDCDVCRGTGQVIDDDPDCSVCMGDWHFYVSIDVKFGEERR